MPQVNNISKPYASHISQYSENNTLDTRFYNTNKQYTTNQEKLLERFKNMPLTETVIDSPAAWSRSVAESEPEYATHYLYNSNFANGSVRILKPGLYVLKENIKFLPNAHLGDDLMPTSEQMKPSGDYPGVPNGYYHMGFFAAITIECKDVILDLNGYVLEQDELHRLQQRFFACVELASAPFIPKAGPSEFGTTFVAAENVYIGNGSLCTSSHHGIHGNNNKGVLIDHLSIANFEVGAIQLNNSETSIIRYIDICNSSIDVPTAPSYSQARFLLRFLQKMIDGNDTTTLNLTTSKGAVNPNATVVKDELVNAMKDVVQAVKDKTELPDSVFKMSTRLYDGNQYGIVLGQGVVVGPFKLDRDHSKKNTDVIVHNINIENIETRPMEILAIRDDSQNSDPSTYGGPRIRDAVGGIFDITTVNNNEQYKQNPLANAQLLIAKSNLSDKGKSNITPAIITWAEGGLANLNQVITASQYYYLGRGDAMGHTTKGNIGIFAQGCEHTIFKNIVIDNIKNSGRCGVEFFDKYPATSDIYDGASNIGMAIVGSEDVICKNISIDHIESVYGKSTAVRCIGNDKNIRLINLKCHNIKCPLPSNIGDAPNPTITARYIEIDPSCYNDISILKE